MLSQVLGAGWLPGGVLGRELEADLPYVALEWFEGESLRTFRALKPSERVRLACAVALDLSQALRDLHAAGSAHADVKPDNVVVQRSPGHGLGFRARLVDLGLSGDADCSIPSGGTLRYLAPEALEPTFRGDGRARDLYALGLTLAEVLDPELWQVTGAAPAVQVSKFPEILAPLIRSLLSPRPEERPSAAYLVRRLQALSGCFPNPKDAILERERAVRRAYLAVRRSEIIAASSGEPPKLELDGICADWISAAMAVYAATETLRRPNSADTKQPRAQTETEAHAKSEAHAAEGALRAHPRREPAGARTQIEAHESRLGEARSLGNLDALGQARWLVRLVGPSAAHWPSTSNFSDSALAQQLLSACERCPIEGLTLFQLDAAEPESKLPNDPVELALAVREPSVAVQVLDRAEALVLSGAAPRALALELVRRFRLRGELSRALQLLAKIDSTDAKLEEAELKRRIGDVGQARAVLDSLSELTPLQASRRAAILARAALDGGEFDQAHSLLAGAKVSAFALEVLALLELQKRNLPAAEPLLQRAELAADSDEQRARVQALWGMYAHARSDAEQALTHFRRAAEYAAEAGAVLEEARYLTGVAAAAADLAELGQALKAAERATLLFEHLSRFQDAARAALSRAAVYAALMRVHEATEAANEALSRAEQAGDLRCSGYAHLALSDALPRPSQRGLTHALLAAKQLAELGPDDRVRAAARVLEHGGNVAMGEFDALARASSSPEVQLTWWGARAAEQLARSELQRPEMIVGELSALATQKAPPIVRGPALAHGALLSLRTGDGEAARRLTASVGEVAREVLRRADPEFRVAIEALPWVAFAKSPRENGLAPEQLRDVEMLVRSLSYRDRLRPLLDQVLDALVLWTGVERGLLLLKAPGGKLKPRAARNLARSDLSGAQLSLSQSLAERALRQSEPVVAVDAAGDLPEVHASVHALKLRSVLAVPLLAQGEALGVVYLDDRVRRGAFGPRELSWVRLVATLAAMAIKDARDQLLLRRSVRRAERAEARLASDLAQREAELEHAERELSRARFSRETRFSYDHIVGRDESVRAMLRIVDRVTPSEVPVLIMGESGSGKELVARAIHENGPRSKASFVTENCAAIPDSLLESTLFGHVRGAFTGASRPRAGLFDVANGGTLFLDEIGEMSLSMQSKLLRVLQDGEIRPVGSERSRRVDVRIIAATHRRLEAMVQSGSFREDLFYRLNVISIRVPPLRERRADIPLLVQHFILRHAKGRKVRVSEAAMRALTRHEWPGNVRQLENEVRRFLVMADEDVRLSHLSPELSGEGEADQVDNSLHVRKRVDALESELVLSALSQTSGNQTRAAELLGLSRFGLQKMIKRLDLEGKARALRGGGGELSEVQ